MRLRTILETTMLKLSGILLSVLGARMVNTVRVGGIYQHYKGNNYKVIAVARSTESPTLEKVVIYESLYDSEEFGPNAVWSRPLGMFTEEIEINGQLVPRFKEVAS